MAFFGKTVHHTINTLTEGLSELGRSDVIENSIMHAYRLVGTGGVKVNTPLKGGKGEEDIKVSISFSFRRWQG